MDHHRTIARLISLTRFEIDIVKAYGLALDHLTEPAMRDAVFHLKADCERHVLELSEVLRALGSEPPAFERDLKGYVMACVTALRSAEGHDGAVRAISALSLAAIERYGDTLDWNEPMEVLAMLQSYQADHRRNLDAVIAETVPAAAFGVGG
ncbi:MAG: hypothetical protein H0V44_07625 [Planctomycetes bacterium]|nr:hypothetical protein [Planctomycetota bacterium]